MEEKECRICFDENDNDELIAPCRCNGTSKYVHRKCLNKWREVNRGRTPYEICMECREEYIVRREFDKEHDKLFKGNLQLFIFISYLLSIIISIIWSIFGNSRYDLLYFLNQSYKEPTTENCNYERNNRYNQTCYQSTTMRQYIQMPNGFYPRIVFHMYFLLTINTILYTIFYYRTVCRRIKRKKKYFCLNKTMLFWWNFYCLRFFILYYVSSRIFYGPSLFFGFAHANILIDGGCFFNFIRTHDEKIRRMNDDNEEYVLDWHMNPTHELEFSEIEIPERHIESSDDSYSEISYSSEEDE